jgi:hypothetical protein
MTIQLLHYYNGLVPGVYSKLGSTEEARLISLGLARDYTFGIDGQNPVLSNAQEIGIASASQVGAVTNLAALTPWFDAYADARNAPVLIQCASDSITFGQWSDGTVASTDAAQAPTSYPAQLARLMNARLGVTNTFSINCTDDRNTYSGSTTTATVGLAAKARSFFTGQTATIALPVCTGFDIIYYESNGSTVDGNVTPTTGSATYNVDAAGAVAITYAGSVHTYKKISVTGLAATTHSVVISGTSGAAFFACQINAHSGAGVMVGRSATIAWTLSDILGESGFNNQSAAARARLLLAFAQGTPSLVILATGQNECTSQNDATKGPQTPVLWAQRIKAVADQLAVFGIPLLFVSEPDPPNSDASLTYKYRDYWQAARDLATPGSNIAHLAIGDFWGDFEAAKASGYVNDAGGVHPLRKGAGSIATLLSDVLGRNPLYRRRLVTGV